MNKKHPLFATYGEGIDHLPMIGDMPRAENEMKSRELDVSEWEIKVNLNNTKEEIASGNYENAVKRLNEAKTRYYIARSAYNSAKSKLNNAL